MTQRGAKNRICILNWAVCPIMERSKQICKGTSGNNWISLGAARRGAKGKVSREGARRAFRVASSPSGRLRGVSSVVAEILPPQGMQFQPDVCVCVCVRCVNTEKDGERQPGRQEDAGKAFRGHPSCPDTPRHPATPRRCPQDFYKSVRNLKNPDPPAQKSNQLPKPQPKNVAVPCVSGRPARCV